MPLVLVLVFAAFGPFLFGKPCWSALFQGGSAASESGSEDPFAPFVREAEARITTAYALLEKGDHLESFQTFHKGIEECDWIISMAVGPRPDVGLLKANAMFGRAKALLARNGLAPTYEDYSEAFYAYRKVFEGSADKELKALACCGMATIHAIFPGRTEDAKRQLRLALSLSRQRELRDGAENLLQRLNEPKTGGHR